MPRPSQMSKKDVEHLQRLLNAFARKFKGLDLRIVRVDGDFGPATARAIREAKWLLGFSKKGRKKFSAKVNEEFLWQLRHPNTAKVPKAAYSKAHPDKAKKTLEYRKNRVRRGRKRRAKRREMVIRNKTRAFFKPGVGTFEGKTVAKWMIPKLEWARRQSNDWGLTSAWRSPAYSDHLCHIMCGAPMCPGRCAGRASNHAAADPLPVPVNGAVDVWGYVKFGQLMARDDCPGPRIFNALDWRDPVHFSPSGR